MPAIRSWPHLTPALARVVVAQYAADAPKNDQERRHLKAALKALKDEPKGAATSG